MKKGKNAPVAETETYVSNEETHIQEFLDMIAPSVIQFETDYFIRLISSLPARLTEKPCSFSDFSIRDR